MMKKLSTLVLAGIFALSFCGYAFAQGTPAVPTLPETKAGVEKKAAQTKTAVEKK